eukprot:1136484-Pelagomonas_calceolata.AAC.2
MCDLGFPTDAVDTVRNLYESATTQVRLPPGRGAESFPVERGTIQGKKERKEKLRRQRNSPYVN